MSKKMEQINSELQKMREIAGNSQSSEAEYQKQQYVNARHEIAQSVYNKYFGDLQSESLKKTANKKKAEKTQKVKADRIVEESTPESDTPQGRKDYTERRANDHTQNKELDWTDANARKAWEQERKKLQADAEAAEGAYKEKEKQLQAQVGKAGEKSAQEADRRILSTMPVEDRQRFEQYAIQQVNDQNKPVELSDPNSTLFLGLFGNRPNAVTGEDFTDLFGKVGGKTRADELAETYMRDENAELNQKVAEKGRALANAGRNLDPSLLPDVSSYDVDVKPVTQAGNDFVAGALSSAASIPLAAVAGTVGTVGQLQSAARSTGRYASLDPNATGTALQTLSGAIRGQVGENLTGDVYDENGNLVKDGGVIGDTLNLLYQGGMSMADSIARAYLGGGAWGGATLAATNTFSQTMAEAAAKGATPAQAALLATADAFIEAATEKIPLDNLIAVAKGKNALGTIKNVLRQAGIEIAEEEASLVGTLLAETAILGDNSDFNQTVSTLTKSGMSEEEAKQQAWKNIFDEAVQTALVSGISGAAGGLASSLKGQYVAPGEDKAPEPMVEKQSLDSLYETSPEAQAESDAQRKNIDDILDGVMPKNQEPLQAEAPSRADEIVNKTLEDIGLKKPSQGPVQNVDTQAAENYNENRRSQTVQDAIDRLNVGGDRSPDINEIMSIHEIAEAERANEGTPTIDLPNREKIREDGYRQAMQKGSWNGTDYTGEVNHDKRMDIVIGLPGSGKSSVYTERLSQEYKSRVIDTDDFREYIPEYNGSNASVVHEESSDIRDMVLNTALDNGDNILLSTIGANAKKLEMQIAEYKAEGYQVYLHLNELPNNKSMARAIGRYIGEDGSLGRYVSPKLIAEYGDKPTQTYLYLTGQGGNENGRLGSDLRKSGRQNIGDVAQTGGAPEGTAGHQRLLAGYDWYNNDVARGEAPRLIQTSEQTTAQSTPQVGTSRASAEGGQPVSGDVDTSTLGKQSAPSGGYETSRTVTNTGLKSADEDIRAAYESAKRDDPELGKYGKKHNTDVEAVARERTSTLDKAKAEADYLIDRVNSEKIWTAEDNVTAKLAVKALFNDGSEESLAKRTELQEAIAKYNTNSGQVSQSNAIIGTMKDIESPMTAADTFFERMYGMEEKDTTYNPQKSGGKDFETWRKEVVTNVAKVAADIDKVPDGDTAAMKAILEDIAYQRGISAKNGEYGLNRRAKKLLSKVTFDDLKTLANASIASMSDDFRKRGAVELAESARKSAMLSAITTFERNLSGNTAIGLLDSASDSTSARIADGILSKFTNKQTVGNDIKNVKQYVQGAKDAATWASLCVEFNVPVETDAAATLDTATNGGNGGKYVGKTFTPNGNAVMRVLYGYQKFQSYELDVSDKVFESGTKSAVSESLKNLKGLSADEQQRLADYTGKRRSFKDATWTDASGNTHGAVASRFGQWAKNGAINLGGKGGEIVGGFFGEKGKEVGGNVGKAATSAVMNKVAPFVSVPSNVAQAGVDYSTGIIKGAAEMAAIIHDAKKGIDIPVERQRQAASDFGRGVSGLGLIGIAAAAAKAGIIAVHNDDDLDKKALEQSEGLSGAQINLSAMGRLDEDGGEKWRSGDVITSLDFLEPFNTHLYLGAELAQYDDMWSLLKNYSGSVFDAALQAFTDSPMVSGLQELQDDIDGLKEGSKSIGDFAAENLGEYVSSYEPQIFRQAAQAIDGYYRDTRGETAAETAFNQLIAGIPFLSKTLPKKVDGLGNEQERPGWLSTFFDPTKTKTYNENEVTTYLGELAESTGDASFYPDRQSPKAIKIGGEEIILSGSQREIYQKAYGDSVSKMYSDLMNLQGFKNLPGDVQSAALKKAEAYATEIAKASIADNPDAPDKTVAELANSIYVDTVKNTINNAFKSISDDAKYGRDNTADIAALEQAYGNVSLLPDDMQKEILEDSGGRLGYYATAKKNGVSTETFLNVYNQYKEISDNKDLTTSEKAQDWSVALDKAERDGTLTAAQKKALKGKMVFRYSMQAETAKYDEMRESGISIEKADKVIDVLDKVVGTGKVDKETGKASVRAIDKYAAIANVVDLTDSEIDAIMEDYMPDYDPEDDTPNKTYLKYEYVRRQLGISPEDYISIYNVSLDGGKKNEVISRWKDLGYSTNEANVLYNLFKATGKRKIDVEAWYADQVGQRDSATTSTGTSSSVNTNRTYQGETLPQGSLDDFEQKLLEMLYGTAK